MSRKTSSILVQDVPVTVMSIDQRDYISLTDMAKARTDAGRAADVIKNWLRARSTLEFLGTWEIMYNPDFKGAVSKWLKQAMRGSAFFRNIFGQAKTECRKNGTQGIIFIRNSKWNEL